MAKRIRFLSLTLLVLGLGACCRANAQEQRSSCFAIHMIKDGKTVAGPESVTFLDESRKLSAEIRDGKFCIPEAMADRGALDMTFIVGKERFYFPRVPTVRLQAPWDISFGGKKSARLMGLPKSMDINKACRVVIHQGEPEIGMIFYPCRVPGSKPLK